MWDRRKSVLGVAALLGVVAFTATGCGETKTEEKKENGGGELTPRTISVSDTKVTPVPSGTVEVTGPVTFEEAETAYASKNYDGAVKLFRGYTSQKPENVWGHYMLGLSAWKARDLDQAESELLRAVELDPAHLKSRVNLVRVYLDKGEPEKAIEHVDAALALDSTLAEGYRLLGRVRDELDQLTEAADAYRVALKLDGEDAWSMNNLGINLIRQDRPEEALGVLARAVQLKPEVALFQNNLGMALELNGYFVKAAEVYQKAVSIDGSYQKAMDNLARVTGREDKAGVTPIDLETLAQNFVGELEGSKVSQN